MYECNYLCVFSKPVEKTWSSTCLLIYLFNYYLSQLSIGPPGGESDIQVSALEVEYVKLCKDKRSFVCRACAEDRLFPNIFIFSFNKWVTPKILLIVICCMYVYCMSVGMYVCMYVCLYFCKWLFCTWPFFILETNFS